MNEITNNESLDDTIDALMTKHVVVEDTTTNTTSELENTQQEPAINQHTHCIYINENTCDPIIQRTVTNTQVTTNLKGKEDISVKLARATERAKQKAEELKPALEAIERQQRIANGYNPNFEQIEYPTTPVVPLRYKPAEKPRDPNDMVFTSYYEEPKPIEEVITIQADKTHLIGFHIGIIIAVVISLFFIKDTHFLQPFVLAIISASSILLAYYMLGDLGMFLTIMVISLYWFIMFMTNRMDFLNTFDDYDYIQKS